jgi:hypothetical protein
MPLAAGHVAYGMASATLAVNRDRAPWLVLLGVVACGALHMRRAD